MVSKGVLNSRAMGLVESLVKWVDWRDLGTSNSIQLTCCAQSCALANSCPATVSRKGYGGYGRSLFLLECGECSTNMICAASEIIWGILGGPMALFTFAFSWFSCTCIPFITKVMTNFCVENAVYPSIGQFQSSAASLRSNKTGSRIQSAPKQNLRMR